MDPIGVSSWIWPVVPLWRPLDASGSELARKGVAFLLSSLAASEAWQ
jgi:hypothetical protein